MSLLLIDIGNTCIHWTLKDSGQSMGAMQSFPYRGEKIETILTSYWSELAAIRQVFICSVATEETNQYVQTWLEQHWQLTPHFIRAVASDHGIQNAYLEPERLGADRWSAMVAAYVKSQHACCVLDCGTAVTFDLIDAKGDHLGGWIMPGYRLFRQSLTQHTASISDNSEVLESTATLGRNTQACIDYAWHQGIIGLIQRSLPDGMQHKIDFFICGGDAKRLLPLLGNEWCYADDLVLQGLAIIASQQ